MKSAKNIVFDRNPPTSYYIYKYIYTIHVDWVLCMVAARLMFFFNKSVIQNLIFLKKIIKCT